MCIFYLIYFAHESVIYNFTKFYIFNILGYFSLSLYLFILAGTMSLFKILDCFVTFSFMHVFCDYCSSPACQALCSQRECRHNQHAALALVGSQSKGPAGK